MRRVDHIGVRYQCGQPNGGAVFVPNMVGFLCDCRKLQVNLRINDMLKAE